MVAAPIAPHLTLVDGAGKKIEGDAGVSGASTIKRKLAPGTYFIWAGAYSGGVGEYRLTVNAEK
jgi:hypothetical protein